MQPIRLQHISYMFIVQPESVLLLCCYVDLSWNTNFVTYW